MYGTKIYCKYLRRLKKKRKEKNGVSERESTPKSFLNELRVSQKEDSANLATP